MARARKEGARLRGGDGQGAVRGSQSAFGGQGRCCLPPVLKGGEAAAPWLWQEYGTQVLGDGQDSANLRPTASEGFRGAYPAAREGVGSVA